MTHYLRVHMFSIKNRIKNSIRKRIIDVIQANSLAIRYNDVFQEYRGIYEGKDIYIIGCGPTERFFNPIINSESIYIGINRAYKDERIPFDFLFAQDQMKEGMKDFLNYRESDCTKFLAIIPHEDAEYRICDCNIAMKKTIRYALAGERMGNIPLDISVEPLADLCGTVFSALQFALFTNPKHIFLVGFDCTEGNEFKNSSMSYNYQLEGWKSIKKYIETFKSPDLVISINPIGLKGFFNDVYTTEFVNENGMDKNKYTVIE